LLVVVFFSVYDHNFKIVGIETGHKDVLRRLPCEYVLGVDDCTHPVLEIVDVRIDSRVVGSSAAIAPAHDTN